MAPHFAVSVSNVHIRQRLDLPQPVKGVIHHIFAFSSLGGTMMAGDEKLVFFPQYFKYLLMTEDLLFLQKPLKCSFQGLTLFLTLLQPYSSIS